MILSPPLIFIVFLVGVLIGGVGIGGVLLVPALKYLGDIPLHSAIPACMVAYIATGAVGAMVFARHGSIQWPMALRVCLGALPGAFIGAWLLQYFSAGLLELGIALLLLFSGVDALRQKPDSANSKALESSRFLIGAGLVTGVGSALTGTGGPLLLIPALIWRRIPVFTAIGLAQVIQIPISFTATIGNSLSGDVNFALGLALGLTLVGGSFIGARIVHMLPVEQFKKAVACLMITVGIAMAAKILI